MAIGTPNIAQGMSQGDAALVRRIENLERMFTQFQAAQTLADSTVGGNGLKSQDFDGTLNPPTQGTTGWGLAGSGGTGIFNQLLLANGIVGDDALTNPLSPVAVHGGAQSFTLTTTQTVLATATVTVPSGFSQALVYATSNVSGINSTSALDSIFAGVRINGVDALGTANGEDANSTSSYHALASSVAVGSSLLTGLSGGTFAVAAKGGTSSSTWASSLFNVANIDAIILFLR